ncbi:MAG TPA: hypothetical protein VGH11_13465 [Jatrophihabitans sp.]|jgi:hypothetical protein
MAGREKPAELEYRSPDCPMCWKETSHDGDSFCCDRCGAYWPNEHSEGRWYDEDAEQCPATFAPWASSECHPNLAHVVWRCALADEHPDEHTSRDGDKWRDGKKAYC